MSEETGREERLRAELLRAVEAEFRERTGINPPGVAVKGTERAGYTVTIATHVRAPDLTAGSVSNVVSEALLAFEVHSKSRDEKLQRAAKK